jgi:signal transduction histidine kinase/CheY-like chemotaxis protein
MPPQPVILSWPAAALSGSPDLLLPAVVMFGALAIGIWMWVVFNRQATDLRASEERFRTLVENSPLGIIEFNYRPTLAWMDGLRAGGVRDFGAWCETHPDELKAEMLRVVFVGANRAALGLAGAVNIDELYTNLPRIFTPETFAARRVAFQAVWDGRNESEGDIAMRSLDGSLRRLRYHWWVPIICGRTCFERTQLVLVDLTDIRSAQSALAAQRERLDVILRAMTESVVTTDPAGLIEFMNPSAGILTGWTPAEASGRPMADVFVFGAEPAGEPIAAPVVAALAANGVINLPLQTVLKPRGCPPRRVEGRCAPMHDLEGRAIGVVLVLRDVTERVRFEAGLLRASKLDSIGVLAGGIAHDFNNLLAIIMGNLTLALLDEKTAAAGGRWLREAERGTRRATALTQQLLAFAKGGEPVRSAVPLGEVVREAAEFALHGSAARCTFDLAADLRPADADQGQVGQVVHNLVINAVQAMPDGGEIRVTLANETIAPEQFPTVAPGDYVRLEIADTGGGIAPDHLDRVFDPFFTTKELGSGLGLATVYSVVQKHGGHVTVASALGRGTTFRVWLPAARVEPPPPAVSTSPFELMRGRVLFMDDEEPIRVMTCALLNRIGLEPMVTSDGRAAVLEYARAQLTGRPFALVIMDLTVPGEMGGAAAMREILKIDPAARGIVSSGYSSDPVMARYREYGFRGMVPKPYRISDFVRVIREVLAGG